MAQSESIRGRKVEARLADLGKSANWLARQVGKPRQSILNWIGGSEPRDENIWRSIAAALRLDPQILLDDSRELPLRDQPIIQIPSGDIRGSLRSLVKGDKAIIPVWRGVAAGTEDECYFVEPDSPEYQEIPAFLLKVDELDRYILCIPAGVSMSPRIKQGDRVVIRLDPNPSPNTIVVAETPDRRRFIKALREKNGLELHSINPHYPLITDLEGWSFVGNVTAIWHPYESGAPNIEYADGLPLKA